MNCILPLEKLIEVAQVLPPVLLMGTSERVPGSPISNHCTTVTNDEPSPMSFFIFIIIIILQKERLMLVLYKLETVWKGVLKNLPRVGFSPFPVSGRKESGES